MQNFPLQDSVTFPGKTPASPYECWFDDDDACILNMDYFVKTLSGIKAKGVRPELLGSIITHYASKWLPELSADSTAATERGLIEESEVSVTDSWMKKRFFVETLVGILPPEKDSVPCNFLLRLLRTANMVAVEPAYRADLETKISWQLDQASLKQLMIPSFINPTCSGRPLLDVELMIRLVKRFVNYNEAAKCGSAAPMVKVAKLVDSYLAEAAVDANLSLAGFDELASALPSHARAMDDGLYRAIDIYLEAHPGISKQERNLLCRLIDSRKFSPEASLHAAQNERLPVRAVLQVLFSEQSKLNRQIDWSGSINGRRSPNLPGFDSKREMSARKMEIKKLREDVARLQGQCSAMQMQMERMAEKKKGIFKWKKFGIMSTFKSVSISDQKIEEGDGERQTPVDMKTRLMKRRTPPRRRKSMS